MIFTNMATLSDILMSASPDKWFSIRGVVETESDYNADVIYEEPSSKPAWQTALDGRDNEQWKVVRSERGTKLQSCDWTMLSDVPLAPSVKTEWETYRQALRDITDQSDPFNIVWPTPPA
jgi:hypothetical protein